MERFLLALIFHRPFRCDKCKARFYGYVYSTPLRVENPLVRPEVPAAVRDAGEVAEEAAEESAVLAQR